VLAAGADGVQLTPGCAPDPELDVVLGGTVRRTHHGWTPHALRRPVWDGAVLVASADSIHPPRSEEDFRSALDAGAFAAVCVEVMYPGWGLGATASIADAMAAGLVLAIDVSHVYIGLEQGALTAATWRRLSEYEHIGEVHVSANNGKRDSHSPLTATSWGLDWAAERLADGATVVVESYWHHLSDAERADQLERVRGALA
jgi:hypothetical protein